MSLAFFDASAVFLSTPAFVCAVSAITLDALATCESASAFATATAFASGVVAAAEPHPESNPEHASAATPMAKRIIAMMSLNDKLEQCCLKLSSPLHPVLLPR